MVTLVLPSTVPLCGDAASLGGVGQGSEENLVLRTPADIFVEDHRRQIEDSAKIFYCDICWEPFQHQGGVRPYEGWQRSAEIVFRSSINNFQFHFVAKP